MRTITEWAIVHGISASALRDLNDVFIDCIPAFTPGNGESEQVGQQRIRLEASRQGARLFRNNIGACTDDRGNFIRYGLANDSAAMNKKIKSGDLIGITPKLVTPDMVGGIVGLFTSIECKRPGWAFKDTPREKAQQNWNQFVVSMGGIAQFATRPEDIWP